MATAFVGSVPVLMLVVPPVEINVECHNASRDHACDQGPAEGKRNTLRILYPLSPQEDSVEATLNDQFKCFCGKWKTGGHQSCGGKTSNSPLCRKRPLKSPFPSSMEGKQLISQGHRVALDPEGSGAEYTMSS